jgi:hypothetical protein
VQIQPKTIKMKTLKTSRKYDLCVRIATHLLTLPPGGWPETQQCERELGDNIPENVTYEEIVKVAARTATHIRREWETAEPFATMVKIYPIAAVQKMAPALFGKI